MSFAALADRLRTSLDGYTSSTKTGEDLQFSREKQAVNNAIRAALVALPSRDAYDVDTLRDKYGKSSDEGLTDQGEPFVKAVRQLIKECLGQSDPAEAGSEPL